MDANSFLNQITHENRFIEDMLLCKENGLNTYIYGFGEGAENVRKRFPEEEGFVYAGNVVDRQYYKGEKGCFALEDVVCEQEDGINLIVAFRGFQRTNLEKYGDKIKVIIDRDCYAGNYMVCPELFTYDYVEAHVSDILRTYEKLGDELSKKTLIAYINQKISMDYKWLSEVWTNNQYFPKDIIRLHEGESFVDCGAYDGDSAKAFMDACHMQDIKDFNIYSFEPDSSNYTLLEKNRFPWQTCYNLAVSDKKEYLHFGAEGTSAGILASGEEVVRAEMLDTVLKDKKVTYIKMDIEGAELSALKGSEKIIRENRPKLAICIYHKREDLWEIADYIISLVPEYKFYIRQHEPAAIELVLYAVPG